MTDDELELSILNEYVARYQEVKTAVPPVTNKCALELDMRDVIHRLTGKEGTSQLFTAELWIDRLSSSSPGNLTRLLMRCSNRDLNTGDHKYHARAFRDPVNNAPSPAWDRIRELQPNLSIPGPVAPTKELEQKFGILFSLPQAKSDFDIWLADTEDQGFSIGVLFIDIDHFKILNERYTETEVDKTILPEVQNLLKQLAANRGAAYRHGGEEFVVLLPNHNSDEVMAFAEKVREAFESHRFHAAGRDEALTVSIGVAIRPDHGDTLDELLAVANEAEHAAKSDGRNTVKMVPHPAP